MSGARRVVWVLAVSVLLAGGCLLSGPSWDKYDDSLRGTNELRTVVHFGQRIGPEGDGCWPHDSERGGTVFCDLVSIGGLHWDTGDVHVSDAFFGGPSAAIDVGAGFVCVLDSDGAVWCWEWSPDIAPRPARAPQGEAFSRVRVVDSWTQKVEGAPGFACGNTADFRRVVCWSVGTDQPRYRQSGHTFVDGAQWVIRSVYDDPPRFAVGKRNGGGNGTFHAFTGQGRVSSGIDPDIVVTETLSS
ncbi:hypothetical protein [Candidatus Poriferisodalis sp.]|uniref:hypothetical protein n=1 Tax=Candidatus Poriferisodalis sp. TaxID=3101277 RepID=UPI003B02C671